MDTRANTRTDSNETGETIGGVKFTAVRFPLPRPHWRYKLQSGYVGHQGYASRQKMWEDLQRAYSLRPDRWESDWNE